MYLKFRELFIKKKENDFENFKKQAVFLNNNRHIFMYILKGINCTFRYMNIHKVVSNWNANSKILFWISELNFSENLIF